MPFHLSSATLSFFRLFLLAVMFIIFGQKLFAQEDSISTIRQRGKEMTEQIESMLREKYYDSNFHGVDLKQKFIEAREQIKKANTNPEVYTIIAQVVASLDDSHTTFFPPRYAKVVDYGFRTQLYGDTCFVTRVKKGSDAEKKGVKAGDMITSFQGFIPNRQTFHQINYFFYTLSPQKNLSLKLKSTDAVEKSITVESTIRDVKDIDKEREKKRKEDFICKDLNAELVVCRLPSFLIQPSKIEKMMSQIKGKKSLILDLRGNSGGYAVTEDKLTGYFFDHKIKIATAKERKGVREIFAKPANDYFGGNLSVLIDSESASASEIFARVIQLEKRGTVIGDQSEGAVMAAISGYTAYIEGTYFQNLSLYGLNITVSDLIMNDGKSLEKTGVSPNILIKPNAFDLAAGRDQPLSFAAKEFGYKLSPLDAAKLFPAEEETEKVVIQDDDGEK